jgi:Fe-S-cluster containining protein
MQFKPCGPCTECCSGLVGSAYGNHFGPPTKREACVFLVEKKCSIYETRPPMCRNYQCAWSQNLFIDIFSSIERPDISGLLISVEIDETKKQFLKCIKLRAQSQLNARDIFLLELWAEDNNTYVKYIDFKE